MVELYRLSFIDTTKFYKLRGVLFMDLSRFPRIKYTNYQTPLEKLEHFSKELNGPNIYIKRDDLLGLTAGGNKTRKLEFGGSNVIGATGYVACAQEIVQQTFDYGIEMQYVVCASGSAGMHSGLVAGFTANHSKVNVIGVNVSREKEEQERNAYQLAQELYTHLGLEGSIPRNAITCYDEYVGPGYALPTPEMAEAVKLLASTEGILLDPVYTGKTMAGLIDLVRKGFFKSSDNVLFIHSGGAPALYAYTSAFQTKEVLKY